MRVPVICSLLLVASLAPVSAASHLAAAKMLEDAAFNHDLARIRMTFEHDIQGPYDSAPKKTSLGSRDSKR